MLCGLSNRPEASRVRMEDLSMRRAYLRPMRGKVLHELRGRPDGLVRARGRNGADDRAPGSSGSSSRWW